MTEFFLKDGLIPTGVSSSMIRQVNIVDDIYSAAIDVIENVNGRHGWNVRGWVRRGHVKDQGIEQGIGQKDQKTTISNKVTYHLSHLEPTACIRADDDELNSLRFDMGSVFDAGFGFSAGGIESFSC